MFLDFDFFAKALDLHRVLAAIIGELFLALGDSGKMPRNLRSNLVGDRDAHFRLRVEETAVNLKRQPFPGTTDAQVAGAPPWRLRLIVETGS